ncbi:MAG: transporter substrate-binding domain-containing protein [Clostridia bacterium]|nr:transporter substrate-binding domain-containing protein [Clostridia bacterium]
MKKITKILAIIMVLAMTACLFASCGKSASGTATEGVLVMATNASFPPYEYTEGDDFAGIDVEIAGLIAEELGLELKIEDVEFGSIIGGVQSGKFDMGMAGMTVTEERLKTVNFSDTYAKGVQSIIVKETSSFNSFDDFFEGEGDDKQVKNIKVGVQQDTTGDIYCSDTVENGGLGTDHVIQYKTGNDAVQALVAGKVDAVIIDNEPAKSYVAANKGLRILDTAYAEEDYAICISKDNPELLEEINSALSKLKSSGKVDEIISKYIAA